MRNEIGNIKTYLAICDCECSIMQFAYFDDPDGYVDLIISYYESAFYKKQETVWKKLNKYFHRIYYSILNKDYLLYEIILNKKKIIELKNIFNSIPL